MRSITLAAAFALAAGAALAADPIEGIWQTQADEGSVALVQIAPCGGAYCGTIVRTFKGKEEYRSPNLGKQIVIGMAPSGGGPMRARCCGRPTTRSTTARRRSAAAR